MSHWQHIHGSTSSDDGVWARRVGPDDVWHIIEVTDMVDAVGSDWEGPPWEAALKIVDLRDITRSDILSALDSCGDPDAYHAALGRAANATLKRERIAAEREARLIAAVACAAHGDYAPMGEWYAPRSPRVARERAQRESRRLEADAGYRAARLSRPVNALGATAREFAQGWQGMQAAINRGIASGDPGANLMSKLYHATDGQTLGGKVDISDLREPNND